jgi:hypothetical protein
MSRVSPNSVFIGVWRFGDMAVGHPAREAQSVAFSRFRIKQPD